MFSVALLICFKLFSFTFLNAYCHKLVEVNPFCDLGVKSQLTTGIASGAEFPPTVVFLGTFFCKNSFSFKVSFEVTSYYVFELLPIMTVTLLATSGKTVVFKWSRRLWQNLSSDKHVLISKIPTLVKKTSMKVSTTSLWLIPLSLISLLQPQLTASCRAYPGFKPTPFPSKLMYEWVQVELDWPNQTMKQQYLQDGRYVPEHNLISGLKTWRGEVYLSVPRLTYTLGVPSTLNKVVMKNGKPVLRPFPSWDAQELGNCEKLQCAMSMEVDPLSGYMYVIDPGRSGILGDLTNQTKPTLCPPKIVVYNLRDGSLVRSHDLPANLVSNETNFLNDIVLDRGSRLSTTVNWVYITDAADNKLIAFDLTRNKTRTFYHPSMDYDPGEGSNITVNGRSFKLKIPIDGLAISSDFNYVYYCALGSKNLYQVPTRALRNPDVDFNSNVRLVGAKYSQTGGMTYGHDNLYYGALSDNAVYKWRVRRDMALQKTDAAGVVICTETMVVQDDEKMQWPDSFTIDEDGYLWFTACRAQLFLKGGIDFSGASGSNFRVWRVKISESSYLASPGSKTTK